MSCFDCLPAEICAHIFSFFHPLDDDVVLMALVCRRWRDIIFNTPSVWKIIKTRPLKCLYLSKAEMETQQYKNVLKMANILSRFGKFVEILNTKHISEKYLRRIAIHKILRGMRMLRILKINLPSDKSLLYSLAPCKETLREFTAHMVKIRGVYDAKISCVSELMLVELAESFSKIEKLVLCDSYISDRTMKAVLGKLTKLSEVKMKFKLESGASYRGNDSDYVRTYRHYMFGRFFETLALSRHAQLITTMALEDVCMSSREMKLIVESLTNLKKLKLENYIEETEEGVLLEFTSHSLEELSIWDVLYIRQINIIIPSCLRLFLSDLHLDMLEITAPKMEELHTGSLCTLSEHIESFTIHSGCLKVLELTDLGDRSSIGIENFQELLRQNPKIVSLHLESFLPKTEITEDLCPSLEEVSIIGTSLEYIVICPTLTKVEVRSDCFNNDMDTEQQKVFVSANCLNRLDLHNFPNLKLLAIDCKEAGVISVSNSLIAEELGPNTEEAVSISLECSNKVSMLNIDRIALECLRLDTDEVSSLNLKNCSFRGDVCTDVLHQDLNIWSLLVENCDDIYKFHLHNEYIEDLSIQGCQNLDSLDCICPSLQLLQISNCPLITNNNKLESMLKRLLDNCPQVTVECS